MISEIMDKVLEYEAGKNFVFGKAKEQVMKMSNGLYPAPLKILEVSLLIFFPFDIKKKITTC